MATYNRYSFGSVVLVSALFTVSSTNTDPTTVTLEVTNPSGTETSYTYAGATVTKAATGSYTKELTPDASGYWKYRWIAGGAVVAANSSKFIIESS